MIIEPNKEIIFNDDITVKLTNDIEFLLNGYGTYIKKNIIECIENMEKTKNIKALQKNISKFPKVGFFYKLILDEYNQNRNETMFKKYAEIYYNKHPEEFFAKLNICKLYGLNGELEKIDSIFGKTFSLKYAFPKRRTYHYTEIINFLIFAINYNLAIDNLDAAIRFELNLSELIKGQPLHLQAKQQISDYKKKHTPSEEKSLNIVYSRREIYPYYNLSENEIEIIEDFFIRIDKLNKASTNLITEINIQADKYPKNPYLKSLISEYYHKLKMLPEFAKHVQDLYDEHPDFLMAKLRTVDLILSSTCITEDKEYYLNKIFEILNKNLSIKDLYPNFDKFFLLDYIYFQFIALRIWLLVDAFFLADNCLKNIETLNGDPNIIKLCHKLIDDHISSSKFKNLN